MFYVLLSISFFGLALKNSNAFCQSSHLRENCHWHKVIKSYTSCVKELPRKFKPVHFLFLFIPYSLGISIDVAIASGILPPLEGMNSNIIQKQIGIQYGHVSW